jgi:hypothetical protein
VNNPWSRDEAMIHEDQRYALELSHTRGCVLDTLIELKDAFTAGEYELEAYLESHTAELGAYIVRQYEAWIAHLEAIRDIKDRYPNSI